VTLALPAAEAKALYDAAAAAVAVAEKVTIGYGGASFSMVYDTSMCVLYKPGTSPWAVLLAALGAIGQQLSCFALPADESWVIRQRQLHEQLKRCTAAV
jgi:hypothetical protein